MLEGRFGEHVAPEFHPHRAGDVKHSLADISRAKEILGYQPRVYFKEGLARTASYFEKNPIH